jgi:hypothetical protein
MLLLLIPSHARVQHIELAQHSLLQHHFTPVSYGRLPHVCAAEFTRKVECQPATIGTAMLQHTASMPPRKVYVK